MAEGTEIGWADDTFNAWEGCSRVSPGCTNCYAEARAHRYRHDVWGKTKPRLMRSDTYWREPVKWNRQAGEAGMRRRVFCSSLADVFEDHPDVIDARQRLWDLIAATPNLDWMLLTKRPENVMRMVPRRWTVEAGNLLCERCGASASLPLGMTCAEHAAQPTGWPANVWIGTTVEDQQRADERVPILLEIPAAIRFLSMEPLLEQVTLRPEWLVPPASMCQVNIGDDPVARIAVSQMLRAAGAHLGWRGVDWVIMGGESGAHDRMPHPDWFRSIRDQVVPTGVPLFFKQWGESVPVPIEDDPTMSGGRAFSHPDQGGRTAAVIKERSSKAFQSGEVRPMEPGDTNGHGTMVDETTIMIRVTRKKQKQLGISNELDGRVWEEVPHAPAAATAI